MSQQIMDLVDQGSLKADAPQFDIGDTVDVHTKILEGDKERIQVFSGTVIARSGSGTRVPLTFRSTRTETSTSSNTMVLFLGPATPWT